MYLRENPQFSNMQRKKTLYTWYDAIGFVYHYFWVIRHVISCIMSCCFNEGSRSYLHWLHFELYSSIEL